MRRTALYFFIALGVSVLIGLPQLWASVSLAAHSTRQLQKGAFAFWGSVPPWGLAALFMYSWGAILNVRFYIGVAPFLIALLVPLGSGGRVWRTLAWVSFFFALGGFNPFCWPLLKLPLVSLLRNPSKFLFFTAFALSMLAGLSLDCLTLSDQDGPLRRDLFRRIKKITLIFLGSAIAVWAALRLAEPAILGGGRWWVKHFVIGKSHHIGDAAEYLTRVGHILEGAQKECSLFNPFFWVPFLFAGAVIFLMKIKKLSGRSVIALAAIDLLIFGSFNYGSGFIGNLRPYPVKVEAAVSELPRDGKWLDVLPEAEAIFPANRNMVTGHAVVGAYSPLLDKDYFLLISDLGVLDDAFGRRKPELEKLGERHSLLNFMGVKYLSLPSGVQMNPAALGEFGAPRRLVYAPNEEKARAYLLSQKFVSGTDGVIIGEFVPEMPAEAEILNLKRGPLNTELLVRAESPWVLTRNQVYDKGWRVRIDGKPADLERINLAFQAVEVPAGEHRVVFEYRPAAYFTGRWFFLAGLILVLAALLARQPRLFPKG